LPVDLAEHVTRLMVNSNSCTASFVQLAGVAALQGDHTPVTRMVAEFKRRRDLLVDGLNRLPGVTCRRPRGAFYVFPNITGSGRTSAEWRTGCSRKPASRCCRARRSVPTARVSPDLLRELEGQPHQGAGADAAAVRVLVRAERAARVTARTTVADVLVDGLARRAAARVFARRMRPPRWASQPGGVAGCRRGARCAGGRRPRGGQRRARRRARRGAGESRRHPRPRSRPRPTHRASARRLIVLTGAGGDAGLLAPVVKASVIVEAASAAHWIAHAAQLAMTDPRGPYTSSSPPAPPPRPR